MGTLICYCVHYILAQAVLRSVSSKSFQDLAYAIGDTYSVVDSLIFTIELNTL